MAKDNSKQSSGQQPRTPQERVDWFVNSSVEESQQLADFHGDATAHQRDRR